MFNYIDKSKGLLFCSFDLQELLNSNLKALRDEVESMEANRLLNTASADLSNYLVEKYKATQVVIRKNEWYVVEREAQIDVRYDRNRWINDTSRPVLVAGQHIDVKIPFEGVENFLFSRANQFNMNPPRAKVHGNEIILSYETPNDITRDLRTEIDSAVNSIEENLRWQSGMIETYNTSLNQVANEVITDRRNRLLANSNRLSSLGIPIRLRTDAPTTYISPEIRKKILPSLPIASLLSFEPEPVLAMELYEHILTVIQNMAVVMERSPSAFEKMHEEDLRQHFLVQLNGQFEGNATGETFNMEGKTDILLRADGKNVFIAECKFWKGQKKFSEAIDQLLGYTSWRDSKTAILVFNRGAEMSTVLAAIDKTAKNHPNYKREVKLQHETGFRYIFHNKTDQNREFLLTVIVFDVPE